MVWVSTWFLFFKTYKLYVVGCINRAVEYTVVYERELKAYQWRWYVHTHIREQNLTALNVAILCSFFRCSVFFDCFMYIMSISFVAAMQFRICRIKFTAVHSELLGIRPKKKCVKDCLAESIPTFLFSWKCFERVFIEAVIAVCGQALVLSRTIEGTMKWNILCQQK